MKVKVRNPIAVVSDVVRQGHVTLMLRSDEYMSNPRQRRLFLLSAVSVGGLCVAGPAMAEGGFAGMLNVTADQSVSGKQSVGKILAAVALGLGAVGGLNMHKRSKEGENSRVTALQIAGPLIAGAVLGATSAVMIKAGETVGLQASQQGQVQ
ncbi:DUF6750 family protein [Achromobacter insuavis]|uniref:DUF6750 family protein n=1 Tax=Achromobacter insuavis TaxID=1287735 RepID=UPI001F144C46|nr:DUF6750 family protein [Achromobacter insuavis]